MRTSFSLMCLLWMIQQTPNYKAQYRLIYHPDSTNMQRTGQESFFLYIKQNSASFFASENLLKKDSVSALVKAGLLTEGDIIANPQNRFKTKFNQFVRKEYGTHSIKIYEFIGVLPYVYSSTKPLEWTIGDEKTSLAGYDCIRATTSYAGRNYEAWFAPEVPISDGPYIFQGLPGLIVKLSDTQKHYEFILDRLNTYEGKIVETPTFRKQQPVEINQAKAFILREENRKNPLASLNRATGLSSDNITFQRQGSSERLPARAAMIDRSWDNNPLELK